MRRSQYHEASTTISEMESSSVIINQSWSGSMRWSWQWLQTKLRIVAGVHGNFTSQVNYREAIPCLSFCIYPQIFITTPAGKSFCFIDTQAETIMASFFHYSEGDLCKCQKAFKKKPKRSLRDMLQKTKYQHEGETKLK